MKDIFLGYDLFGEKVYWKDLDTYSSVLIAGLSGSGKSFLSQKIIEAFYEYQFKIYAISDKVYVDFKADYIHKIEPHTEKDKLKSFIEDVKGILSTTKAVVEKSSFSHIRYTNKSPRLFILIDELWSLNSLDKALRNDFESLCELIIRQGRYLGIFILFVTQISSVSETAIPIRQCSIILTGRTDTKQLSESLFGSDIGYANHALNQPGCFVFWNRKDKPKIIRISNELKGLRRWILKLLNKI